MKIEKGRELLYLSRADVMGCAISPADANAAIEAAFVGVPIRASRGEFLDASWISPGTFVSMIDVRFSWRRETLRAFDRVVTDDLDHGIGSRGVHFGRPIESDLAGIASAWAKTRTAFEYGAGRVRIRGHRAWRRGTSERRVRPCP